MLKRRLRKEKSDRKSKHLCVRVLVSRRNNHLISRRPFIIFISVPYMQRGGKWDNTDIRGASNKKRWLQSDKKYASGGYRKEQSVSIFGYGDGLDWTGSRGRMGPSESIPAAAPKFSRNYKPPNIANMKGAGKNAGEVPKKKGPFGLW